MTTAGSALTTRARLTERPLDDLAAEVGGVAGVLELPLGNGRVRWVDEDLRWADPASLPLRRGHASDAIAARQAGTARGR
jgi:hypothetical protein